MKSLLQPDGRALAPWQQAENWPGAAPMAVPAATSLIPADSWSLAAAPGGHPLGEPQLSAALRLRAEEIVSAFAPVEPLLRRLASRQFEEGFPEMAHHQIADNLGVDVPVEDLHSSWSRPIDLGRIHAQCILGVFANMVERQFDRNLAHMMDEGEAADVLIKRFGFHAIDITSCSDGRLGGAVDYILRVPPAMVVWHDAYAGSMFEVEDALHRWEGVELRRWREGWPNKASEPTQYLKIGIYHFSSLDPTHKGCAGHGSDEVRAASALLGRLREFKGAVEATQNCEATAAILLVGVDTDTDAIRVHIPDSTGNLEVARYLSSANLYDETEEMGRESAKEFIRKAVADCMGADPADEATEGIRWLCGYLLKNNIGQVDAARSWNGGTYADAGHGEKLVVAGDALDDVQLRNLAYQAQMDTVEEGAFDLDVGVHVLEETNGPGGLAIPILVHALYDDRIPGARSRAEARAARLAKSILSRYQGKDLVVRSVTRARGDSQLHLVPSPAGNR